MIHRVLAREAPVAELFELASTSFQASAFRTACDRFASFDPSHSDEFLWTFFVDGARFVVGTDEGLTVQCAILSLFWWETFLPDEHPDRASFESDQAEFDHHYEQELQRAVASLGSPQLAGRDEGVKGHRWAIWRGQTGLLVLQQSGYDPQFGLDINYWVCPWTGADVRPTSPFIDWLNGVAEPSRPTTEAP